MQNFMIERIEREASNQKAGKKSRIAVKVNGLLEPVIVKALYRASQAGVTIDIMCRGICALRPGVPGVSDNIRVISVIDRFLEHSRIFYFENAGEPDVYIGSADWMDRNLSRRVEVVFPIEQPDLKARLIDEILGISLRDTAKCRELNVEGHYTRVQPPADQPPMRSQNRFLELAMEAEKKHLLATRPTEPTSPATPKLAPRTMRRKKG
jgi:polyphosphate kinase